MEFRVLGPLEVVDGLRALDLGGPKQRALLALLVLMRVSSGHSCASSPTRT